MTRTRKGIKIVSVGQMQPDVLEYLACVLPSSFDVRCEVQNLQLDVHQSYNAKRRQFDSNQILQQLRELPIGEGEGKSNRNSGSQGKYCTCSNLESVECVTGDEEFH